MTPLEKYAAKRRLAGGLKRHVELHKAAAPTARQLNVERSPHLRGAPKRITDPRMNPNLAPATGPLPTGQLGPKSHPVPPRRPTGAPNLRLSQNPRGWTPPAGTHRTRQLRSALKPASQLADRKPWGGTIGGVLSGLDRDRAKTTAALKGSEIIGGKSYPMGTPWGRGVELREDVNPRMRRLESGPGRVKRVGKWPNRVMDRVPGKAP
jgi:hypothetical protein